MNIRIAVVALAAIMAAGIMWIDETAGPDVHPYVSYDISEHRHGETDDREIRTQFHLYRNAYPQLPYDNPSYSYGEAVYGATTPTVHTLRYDNAFVARAGRAERARLVRDLIAAGIFTLKDDPDVPQNDDGAKPPYRTYLDFDIDGREIRLSFNTPPTSGARLAVHEVLTRFIHKHDIDRPRGKREETLSEGDLVPARAVGLAELIAHPETYDGKRVRVTGYLHWEFEGNAFCTDKAAAQSDDESKCLWWGQPSSFAREADLNWSNDSYQTLDGVFFKGPTGHMGLSPGEIERVTRAEPAPGRP